MQRAKNATPYMRLSCLVLASLKHRKLLQSGFLLSRVTGDDFHCLLQPDCLPVIGQQVESVLRIRHYGLVTIHIPALALIDILYKIAVCACIPRSCIHVHGKYEHREVVLPSFEAASIIQPSSHSSTNERLRNDDTRVQYLPVSWRQSSRNNIGFDKHFWNASINQ